MTEVEQSRSPADSQGASSSLFDGSHPTEADEEARRAYREQEDMTGASSSGPGSATSNRDADMMYLLRRHILGRNSFLAPDCVDHVPEAVRRYHSKCFREAYEAVKWLDYDNGIVPPGDRAQG
jgi:hypothetical protein